MIRLVTGGLILLPLLGLLSGTAPAATDFQDIPYLQARINQVLEREPTGAEVEWRNEATGNAGVIRVLKTYFPSPDAPCRDYERTTRQPGRGESLVRGTGCRDASGRWGLKEMEETEAPSAESSTPESSTPKSSTPKSSTLEPPTPEPWSPEAPAGGGARESTSPVLSGGQSQQSGGQSGAQGQYGGQSQGQSQGQTGGAGQAGQANQTQSGGAASVLPGESEPESAAPRAASGSPEPPKPTAPAPRESASSLPEIELPTRSE